MTDDLPEIISEQLDKHMPAPRKPTTRRAPKKWYKSKTLILHILNALQAILVLASQVLATHPNGTLTQAELLALGVSITTIILRVLVDQPIEGGPKA
jgi:steroid 5-alpha reductase family enzyme